MIRPLKRIVRARNIIVPICPLKIRKYLNEIYYSFFHVFTILFSAFLAASANHLGTITVLTVGILLAIMFVGYQMRKRNRILNHRPNPMTMTVNEFRDEEMGGTELPPSSSASFPVNGNTSGSGVGGNNWRRPPNNDRLTLVEHMEQNR